MSSFFVDFFVLFSRQKEGKGNKYHKNESETKRKRKTEHKNIVTDAFFYIVFSKITNIELYIHDLFIYSVTL